MMCLCIDYLGLSYLGFTQFLESVGLYFLPNLGDFQPLFLSKDTDVYWPIGP